MLRWPANPVPPFKDEAVKALKGTWLAQDLEQM